MRHGWVVGLPMFGSIDVENIMSGLDKHPINAEATEGASAQL